MNESMNNMCWISLNEYPNLLFFQMNFYDTFSLMMKQRYPIFCSVFTDAYKEDTDKEKYTDFDYQNSYSDPISSYTENPQMNDFDDYYEIDLNDNYSYQPKEQEELDFAHDLQQVSNLIEKMVISLQPPEEWNKITHYY